jgi:hypothetical protein
MLSALPKLADKTFIVGFFLPVLLFSFLFMTLFSDYAPLSELMWSISKKENLEKLVYLTLGVWVLSILLMMVNHIQYQTLEGYVWPFNRFAKLKARERDRFLTKKQCFDKLTNEWRERGDHFPPQKRRECDRLEMYLVRTFPAEEHLLPTRFGNAIRAFEVYSSHVYGADSIPLWPHLATVMSKEMKGTLDDARAQVDFLVNVCCLAVILGVAAATRLVVHIATWAPPWINRDKLISSSSLFFVLFILGSALVCAVAYRWSIHQIQIWGAFVKAAFDCYLPALAKRLGYKLPKTESEQRAFWTAVSQMAIYHRPMPDGLWPRIQDEEQKNSESEKAAVGETGQPETNQSNDSDSSEDE